MSYLFFPSIRRIVRLDLFPFRLAPRSPSLMFMYAKGIALETKPSCIDFKEIGNCRLSNSHGIGDRVESFIVHNNWVNKSWRIDAATMINFKNKKILFFISSSLLWVSVRFVRFRHTLAISRTKSYSVWTLRGLYMWAACERKAATRCIMYDSCIYRNIYINMLRE